MADIQSNEILVDEQEGSMTVSVSAREKNQNCSVDFATVTVKSTGSGEVVSKRRVFLLAESFED